MIKYLKNMNKSLTTKQIKEGIEATYRSRYKPRF